MPATSIPACALAAVVIAGCGSSHKAPTVSPQQQRVTSTLRAYLKAQASGDGRAACATLTARAQQQLVSVVKAAAGGLIPGRPSCAQAVSLASTAAGSNLMSALAHATIAHVQISGSTATARVSAKGFPAERVTLKKASGGWKITGVPNLAGVG